MRILVIAWSCHGGSPLAGTLAELADAQRAKQAHDLAKQRMDAEELATSAAARRGASTPRPPASVARVAPRAPRVSVHALYSVSGAWIAEIVDERMLTMALPGMRWNGALIQSVGERGVTILTPCGASRAREGRGCGERVLRVGDSF